LQKFWALFRKTHEVGRGGGKEDVVLEKVLRSPEIVFMR